MKNDEEQVLDISDEAAVFEKNIIGWVDRHGRYFGSDERTARWSGCTHITCECGNVTKKEYAVCSQCRAENAIERYEKKEKIHWDGKTPLYSDAMDEYFMDEDELRDFLEEHVTTINSLRLLICEPVYLRHIESDYFCDELSEYDDDLPNGLEEALKEFNNRLDDIGIVSWTSGDCAVKDFKL